MTGHHSSFSLAQLRVLYSSSSCTQASSRPTRLNGVYLSTAPDSMAGADPLGLCRRVAWLDFTTAQTIFSELEKSISEIEFTCKSGILKVKKKNGLIELNFPSRPPIDCEIPDEEAEKINTVQEAIDYVNSNSSN